MSTKIVELITRKEKRQFVILKGKRDVFQKMVQARLYAIGALAYSEWEQAALNRWRDSSTGWRYIEGLYWEALGNRINIGVQSGSFGSLLESGWERLDLLPALKNKAIARGGKLIVPIGGNKQYFSPAKTRQKIPTQGALNVLIQKHSDNPGIVINKINGVMQTRQVSGTAMTTKPLGIFLKSGKPDAFKTVTINTPSHMWKTKEYRGAMIADQVATTVDQLGKQFMSDLWPQVSTVDL